MRLIGVVGAGLLGAGICCCGDPGGWVDRIRSLFGEEEAAPPDPVPVAQPVIVEEPIEIGIPKKATVEPAPEGVFLRYRAPIPVERSRQFHDRWFRENGWQVQVDAPSATGWNLEGVKGEHRLVVAIMPVREADGSDGVNVVFTLL